MTPEEKQQFEDLKSEVSTLKKRLDDLSNPASLPDNFLQALVSVGFLRANTTLNYISASNNDWRTIFVNFLNSNLAITGDDISYYVKFTASTSDTCTSTSAAPETDTQVYLISTGTLPAPLSSVSPYYVVSSSGNTFKLSTSLGGAAVNITDVGSGAHYLHIQ